MERTIPNLEILLESREACEGVPGKGRYLCAGQHQ